MIEEMLMDALSLADFIPYLNQPFHIRLTSEDTYSLELVEAAELGDATGPSFRKPFSLIFRNPDKTNYLPQRIYCLEHEKMGSLDLFIVPLGPDASGMRYQVIFN
jgi:hypothetical protein